MKLSIIHEPYPFESNFKSKLINPLLFGCFVALFLIFFQPFGLSNYQSDFKTTELVGYGLVTTSSLFLNYLFFNTFFSKWYTKENWTVGKNILFTLYIFIFIGISNLLYSNYLGFLKLSLDSFIYYQGITVIIGIIPVSISTLFVYNKKLKSALTEAKELNNAVHSSKNQSHQIIELLAKNKKENLKLSIDELLAITAIENYIEVYYYNEGLQKSILRNTLKTMEELLSEFSFVQQCHRSYLVNLEKVIQFNGNAQGLSLSFGEEVDLQIPVSRKFVPTIKSKLQ